MGIKHATTKAPGEKLFAVADWNGEHTITDDLDFLGFNIENLGGIFDNAETPLLSIDPNNRILYDSDENVRLTWEYFSEQVSSNVTFIPLLEVSQISQDGGVWGFSDDGIQLNYGTLRCYNETFIDDGDSFSSIDPHNRILKDASEYNAINWSGTFDNLSSMNWVLGEPNYWVLASPITYWGGIYDGTEGSLGNISIDTTNRILYASDGSTPLIEWGDTNSSQFNWDGVGFNFLNPITSWIDGLSSVDTANRVLYADGGSPVFNWAEDGALDMAENVFKPKVIETDEEPTLEVGELVIWRTTSPAKVYLKYNDAVNGNVTAVMG